MAVKLTGDVKKDFQALAEEVIGADVKEGRRQCLDSLQKQLDSISSSANELLTTVKLAAAPKVQRIRVGDMDEKLAEFYGVRQVTDAVLFSTLYPRAKSVQIAGDFNNWQPTKTLMQKVGKSGVWQTKLQLHPGKYRYRLVVDGHWQQDPYNEVTELNPFGGFNSVIEVK